MKNINIIVVNDLLTITVDLSKDFGMSKSGKSTIIASTEGNVVIAHGSLAKLGMNVYK